MYISCCRDRDNVRDRILKTSIQLTQHERVCRTLIAACAALGRPWHRRHRQEASGMIQVLKHQVDFVQQNATPSLQLSLTKLVDLGRRLLSYKAYQAASGLRVIGFNLNSEPFLTLFGDSDSWYVNAAIVWDYLGKCLANFKTSTLLITLACRTSDTTDSPFIVFRVSIYITTWDVS